MDLLPHFVAVGGIGPVIISISQPDPEPFLCLMHSLLPAAIVL